MDSSLSMAAVDIQVILGYNSRMLDELQSRLASWDSCSTKIGDVFIKMAAFLKAYTQYLKHYKELSSILAKHKKKSEFKKMLESLPTAECRSLGLKDYLIMPVQRIPRYSLLLRDLLNNTWADHIDYEDLRDAVEKVRSVAQYVEDFQEESYNVAKVREISQSLSGKNKEFLASLVAPHRRFVRESDVDVVSREKGLRKSLHIILFNDLVVFTRQKRSSQLVQQALGLSHLQAIDDSTYNGKAVVDIATEEETYTLLFPSDEDADVWKIDMKRFQEEALQRRSFGTDVTSIPEDYRSLFRQTSDRFKKVFRRKSLSFDRESEDSPSDRETELQRKDSGRGRRSHRSQTRDREAARKRHHRTRQKRKAQNDPTQEDFLAAVAKLKDQVSADALSQLEAAERRLRSSSLSEAPICREFSAAGYCARGDKCPFSHKLSAAGKVSVRASLTLAQPSAKPNAAASTRKFSKPEVPLHKKADPSQHQAQVVSQIQDRIRANSLLSLRQSKPQAAAKD